LISTLRVRHFAPAGSGTVTVRMPLAKVAAALSILQPSGSGTWRKKEP
jgi:hypothetical protein